MITNPSDYVGLLGAHEAWARIRQTIKLMFKVDIQATIN